MEISNVINIIAIILSPVIAVLITIWLNHKMAKRKERMELFKTLMATRYLKFANHEQVRALNSIDVIFDDRPKARQAWSEYYTELCRSPINSETLGNKNLRLLEAMAKDLGYKEKISWENIKSCYMPTGLWNSMQEDEEKRQIELQLYRNAIQTAATTSMPNENNFTYPD